LQTYVFKLKYCINNRTWEYVQIRRFSDDFIIRNIRFSPQMPLSRDTSLSKIERHSCPRVFGEKEGNLIRNRKTKKNILLEIACNYSTSYLLFIDKHSNKQYSSKALIFFTNWSYFQKIQQKRSNVSWLFIRLTL
jgi:hypothetical protein